MPATDTGMRAILSRAVLDTRIGPPLDSAPHLNTGDERDEYPSPAGTETRWLVETGTAAMENGPGSLRTERGGRDAATSVGSGAERQR